MVSRACLRAPQGDDIIQYYTDSFGKPNALQSGSGSSSGHSGRLTVIIGPDLWDDGRTTYQRLLSACVNMPKELRGRDSVHSITARRSWRPAQLMFLEWTCIKASIRTMVSTLIDTWWQYKHKLLFILTLVSFGRWGLVEFLQWVTAAFVQDIIEVEDEHNHHTLLVLHRDDVCCTQEVGTWPTGN